ncbi:MAG: GNAT family N-acetyltransferase [Chloroflexi bacterium AL-W]|nr:GNAT family N-acetyltransferase [Chloroflexi bacterium AL-N1]NOK69987.1 GNAT family N-acetyltransferase [Chloroflexi bacterium AL-N10]NOK73715.1 GNAT family N-acetyltransferase [Chloroflexi bacterium AL-N5]NOK85519.1 GNAT family N-acetyltransferase [Chloroflexi bacterium AL-W]NOK91720.1 GNAT family N-acetyltransferase [Chloroflexi bacterium AL-N15]
MASEETQLLGPDAVVGLREITKETVREILKLKVAPSQESFVAPNAVSIAQAYFEDAAWFRAIYADETPIGFVMLYDDSAKPEYMLWRFMIDARFQRYGFGRTALELIIAHVKTRPDATALFTSCVPGDGSPCPFYEKIGFVDTGEVDDGEKVLRYDL